jgi:phospholipase C
MTTSAGAGTGLAGIQHIVVLMLENRSFDHMLGYLYADTGNVSPSGQPFEGLTGSESNPDANGNPVKVYPITPSTPNAYFMPGADPGEGYKATNDQLWGSDTAPASGTQATMQGFIKDFAYTIKWETSEKWSIVSGTTADWIMGCFTPQALPVLSALAKGYAVCDHWFASAPTETLPNRAFALAGTSQGHMDDHTKTYTCPSIFGSLAKAGLSWRVFGYDKQPLTKADFPDITSADASHFGLFKDFQAAAAVGTLPAFTFLEPSWSSTGNSQHPNYDVALGEQLIHDTYEALRSGPGWGQTLFVLTYDEHGGCYDHVPPPWGATPPDNTAGEFGFGFDRFGVRVPTVLVSPLIAPGTVYRVPGDSVPLDHTSILKTIEQRWNVPSLTARDAAAPGFGDVITLATPRTDDVLAGVTVPVSGSTGPSAGQVSHLEAIRDELIARYADGPRPAASPAADGAPAVVQDPDQRPSEGLVPEAAGVAAAVVQDPDQRPGS